jgi:hypothetical protein
MEAGEIDSALSDQMHLVISYHGVRSTGDLNEYKEI